MAKKTIPFDLKLWQTGEYNVITKGGAMVTQLTYFAAAHVDYVLYGILRGIVMRWTIQGEFEKSRTSIYDLKLIK